MVGRIFAMPMRISYPVISMHYCSNELTYKCFAPPSIRGIELIQRVAIFAAGWPHINFLHLIRFIDRLREADSDHPSLRRGALSAAA